VLVITDGLIGFESEIVAEIRSSLPDNSRVHTLGVGHGVNRSLTGPAARAGGGHEAICAPGEDVEPVLARLLQRTNSPQLVDLRIEGDALIERAPQRVPDLFAGAPVRLALRLRPEGGSLTLRATAPEGEWTQRVHVPACAPGEGPRFVSTLFARERVEDLETARASGESIEKLDAEIERIGLELQIATRRTSWVAIDEESHTDPTLPTREVSVPHTLAAGLSAQGVGLRSAAMPMFGGMPPAAAAPMSASMVRRRAMSAPVPLGAEEQAVGGAAPKGKKREGVFKKMAERVREAFAPPPPSRPEPSFDAMEAEYAELSDEEADTTLAEEAAPELPATRLDARVLVERDDKLILSFTLDKGLEWDPEEELELLDENGEVIAAKVDLSNTTGPSSIDGGVTIRLSLQLDATAGTPSTLCICGLELRLSR
jgi:Ca-activated chloride channel family protein